MTRRERTTLRGLAVVGWLALLDLAFMMGVVGTLESLHYAVRTDVVTRLTVAHLAVAVLAFEVRRALRTRWRGSVAPPAAAAPAIASVTQLGGR